MAELICKEVPEHIAIIMDGNRRWAKSKGLNPTLGHKEGAKVLENMVRSAKKLGVKHFTVYAFSTENWKRKEEEVSAIMLLLKNYLDDFSKRANTENIQIRILGDISSLPKNLRQGIENAIERTKNNDGIIFNIAFNYGGRAEIVRAAKVLAQQVKENKIAIEDITEESINDNLYTKGQPDPDLVIRTSGEIRTSNFLPWQITYSEFLFVEKNWPDFTEDDLIEAINVYNKRTRKFGAN